ncbi:MAG: 3-methyl-2-oxobutanoate dehydrogenase subunit VorB [Opitutales bacterium]|nr:3-methyl-2-oxobutanoate dehydrogenase subunit VorB [Opitutales bacterium]
MSSKNLLLCGNEALVYGALLAGCDAYFGYPITPAGEIIECAAKKFPELGRVFIQAESEIGSINMVMGAAAAGQRAMTASSGLGISLMQEAVSYLAGMEIPCVIADITRSGPGIGNISVEQSDYFQIVKGGGHGGYRCPVFAPASAQEMCDMAFRAFDTAEKYRTPVYILTDGMIGQMMESVTLPEPLEKPAPAPYSLAPGNARTNHFTSIYLEAEKLEKKNEALLAKYREMEANDQDAELWKTDDAEIVLVAYGIMSRLAKNAVDGLRERGIKAGLVRPKLLFPFPKNVLTALVDRAKKFVCIELSGGQMIEDIKLAIECRRPVELIHRVGGKLISVEELVAGVKALA